MFFNLLFRTTNRANEDISKPVFRTVLYISEMFLAYFRHVENVNMILYLFYRTCIGLENHSEIKKGTGERDHDH